MVLQKNEGTIDNHYKANKNMINKDYSVRTTIVSMYRTIVLFHQHLLGPIAFYHSPDCDAEPSTNHRNQKALHILRKTRSDVESEPWHFSSRDMAGEQRSPLSSQHHSSHPSYILNLRVVVLQRCNHTVFHFLLK